MTLTFLDCHSTLSPLITAVNTSSVLGLGTDTSPMLPNFSTLVKYGPSLLPSLWSPQPNAVFQLLTSPCSIL